MRRLFVLLEDDSVSEEARKRMIDSLLLVRSAPDMRRMLGLARGLAAGGRKDLAARFYRFAARIHSLGGTEPYYMGSSPQSRYSSLVAEVEKAFGEVEGPRVALDVLDALEPSSQMYATWLSVALDTWERLLSPEECAAKVAALVPMIGEGELRQQFVSWLPQMARLLLQAGNEELGLHVLERYLCDDVETTRYIVRFGKRNTSLFRLWRSTRQDDESGDEVRVDLVAVARKLLELHEADRLINPSDNFRELAGALSKAEEFDADLARELEPVVMSLAGERTSSHALRATLFRLADMEDTALAIESKLYQQGDLPPSAHGRLPELARIQAGPRARATCGATCPDASQRHEQVIEEVIRLATKAEDQELVERAEGLRALTKAQRFFDEVRTEEAQRLQQMLRAPAVTREFVTRLLSSAWPGAD